MISLELFSGAGGLAKGLQLAGFQHAAFVEFNRYAHASLVRNFDSARVFFGDVRDFDLKSVSNIDVVAGGPPCQPFSLGGKHRAHNDTRDMFPYAISAIRELTPKAFIFENVKGILRPSFADYFDYILLRLTFPGFQVDDNGDWRVHLDALRGLKKKAYHEPTYDVLFKLVNAADYGVPQTRERVVIVGTRSDLSLTWSFPSETHSIERLNWEMYVSGDYCSRHKLRQSELGPLDENLRERIYKLKASFRLFEPPLKPWQTVRDALQSLPDPRSKHDLPDHTFRDGARSYAGHTGSDIDWPAKTIKAGDHGVPGGENMIRYRDGSIRYFTVREAKRIQTFPDDFVITGAWGEAMRQIGNAVPVLLAEILGKQLFSLLADNSKKTETRKMPQLLVSA